MQSLIQSLCGIALSAAVAGTFAGSEGSVDLQQIAPCSACSTFEARAPSWLAGLSDVIWNDRIDDYGRIHIDKWGHRTAAPAEPNRTI